MDELRRTGRTTRIVNDIIEELFKNGEAICKDHYDSYESHNKVAGMVKARLWSDHPNTSTVIDHSGGEIKIKLQN